MQCKFCQIEITADIRHFRIKSVCLPCFKKRASEYQRTYHKKGKYKHLQAEYKANAERRYPKPSKVKPKEQSKEDALFNRLIKRAIYANHALSGHIRAETIKNVMERL